MAASKRKATKAQNNGSAKKTASGKTKVEWKGYVNFSLNDSDKRKAEEYRGNPDWLDTAASHVCEEDYKLSVSYDNYNDCIVASLYCKRAGSPNAGYCLTARASHWYEAIFRVLYVHYVALDEDWNAQKEEGWDDSQW